MIEFKDVSFSRGGLRVFSRPFLHDKRGLLHRRRRRERGRKIDALPPLHLAAEAGFRQRHLLRPGHFKKSPGPFRPIHWIPLQNPDRQICRATPAEEVIFSLKAAGLQTAGARGKAEALLSRMGIAPGADLFSLSRSARQMTALASLLIKEPKLLILDEPTSALGCCHRELAEELLREEKKRGATILMVTHDMELAESAADDILYIAEGKAAAHGPTDEIMERFADGSGALRPSEMRELGRRLGAPFAGARGVDGMAAAIKDAAAVRAA